MHNVVNVVNIVDVVCTGLQHFESMQSSSSHSSLSRSSPITVKTGSLPDFEVITLRESLVYISYLKCCFADNISCVLHIFKYVNQRRHSQGLSPVAFL